MKKLTSILTLLVAAFTLQVQAQTNDIFIRGDIHIKYNTKTMTIAKGIQDVYNLNINVCNSALFKGVIVDNPLIMGGWMKNTVQQQRSLAYDVALDVVNPKNPAQTKNVGRMYGAVPIEISGLYRYDLGSLQISVLPMGNAGGFDSKFSGTVQGKPLNRPADWLDKLKCEAKSITRKVNGKTTTVTLKKYDKMNFIQHVVAAGPVHLYQPSTVNSEMLYDYDKSAWFFNNVTIQYAVGNTVKIDRLSGNIRWVEAKGSSKGEYQFDIRVNEPPATESSAFTTTSGDESAFFETDTTIPAFVGTMVYEDTKQGGTTIASNVKVNIVGNNVDKQITMAFAKMLLFSCVVPLNND